MTPADPRRSSRAPVAFCCAAVAFLAALYPAPLARGEQEQPAPHQPYLLVEAWFDREGCSDLYAFDLDGKPIRRLTAEPLPSCSLVALSPAFDGQLLFVANASALYALSVRHNMLCALHGGDVGPVSLSPDGSAVAYTARGFEPGAGRFLRVQPLYAGATVKRSEIPLTDEATELALAPDAGHVLFGTWVGGRGQILACNLDTRKIRPFLTSPTHSYSQAVFAPDGKSILAIREDLDAGEWAVVLADWPDGDPKVVRRGGPGNVLSEPLFTADKKHVLFDQDGVLVRCTSEGEALEGLSGPIDEKPRQVIPRGLIDRHIPARRSRTPSPVARHIARLEWKDQTDMVELIDIRTGEKKDIPLPKGKIMRAVVVE